MLPNDSSRFFHTLVVLGAALGAGCGGSLDTPPADEASPTGGSAAGGSPAASGGSSGGSSGGATAAGGSVAATGGVLVEPPPETGWPFSADCQTEQQTCDESRCSWGLPASPCVCEPERPLAASDCPDGQDFVCRAERVWIGDIDVEVHFGCSCVAKETACDCSNGGFADGCDASASPRTILCGGCAVILK